MNKERDLLKKVLDKGVLHSEECRLHSHHACDCGATDLYVEIRDIVGEMEADDEKTGDISSILNAFLLVAVSDTQGIYPAEIHQGDKITCRTDWQNGWNEAQSNLVKDWCVAEEVISTWTKAEQNMLEDMLISDEIHIYIRKEKCVELMLNMNDTFHYACSDCEIVPLGSLKEVYDLWKAYGFDGSMAWVSNKRDTLPIKPLQTPRFFEALAAAKGVE